ncbi:MAG: hypothetical protein KDD62_00515 [Bdellovibrionales bacterium]|nr:hypothetical protein [Bdellovibrionales bacterium]
MSRLTLCIVVLLSLIYFVTPVTEVHGGAAFDGRYYMAMAMRDVATPEFVFHPPWCWRILTPFLVSLLPHGQELLGFQVLNFGALLVTLLLLVDLVKRVGGSGRAQWFALLGYTSVFWTTQSVFHFPVMVDAGGQLFVFWALNLMVRKGYWTLPFVLFIGMFQKESTILLAPVISLYWYSNGADRKTALLYLALLLTVCAIPIGMLKILIPGVVAYHPEAVLRMTFVTQALSLDFWPRMLIAFFSGLSIFSLLVLSFPKQTLAIVRREPYLLLYLCFALILLFGGSGKSRLLLHALAPLVLISVHLIDTEVRRDRIGNAWLWTTIGLAWLVNFAFYGLQDFNIFRTWINPIYTSLSYGSPPVFVKLSLSYAYLRLACLVGGWSVLFILMKPRRKQSQ